MDSSSKSNSSKFKSSSLSSSLCLRYSSAFFCTAFSCASLQVLLLTLFLWLPVALARLPAAVLPLASSTADIGWLCDSDCELSTVGSLVPAIPLPTALPALSPQMPSVPFSAVVPVFVCAKVSCFSSGQEDVFLEITSPIQRFNLPASQASASLTH